MMPRRWEPLLDRLHDEWRDRILTALTLLMVVHLFIVAPFLGMGGMTFASLFSTHPPIAKRIERLTGRSAEFV